MKVKCVHNTLNDLKSNKYNVVNVSVNHLKIQLGVGVDEQLKVLQRLLQPLQVQRTHAQVVEGLQYLRRS